VYAARAAPCKNAAPARAPPPLPPPPPSLLVVTLAAQPQLTVACQAAASAMLARKTPNANQPSTWHSSATSARLPTHVQQRRPSQAQQEPATSGTWEGRRAAGRAGAA
jgi:hypothetical protein